MRSPEPECAEQKRACAHGWGSTRQLSRRVSTAAAPAWPAAAGPSLARPVPSSRRPRPAQPRGVWGPPQTDRRRRACPETARQQAEGRHPAGGGARAGRRPHDAIQVNSPRGNAADGHRAHAGRVSVTVGRQGKQRPPHTPGMRHHSDTIFSALWSALQIAAAGGQASCSVDGSAHSGQPIQRQPLRRTRC